MTTDKPTPELLPCPFCGEKKDFETVELNGWRGVKQCMNCGAHGPYQHEEADQQGWNTRPELRQAGVDECPKCNGDGCTVEVRAVCCGKNPDGSCHGDCPIAEQYQERCDQCNGEGKCVFQPAAQKTEGAEALRSLDAVMNSKEAANFDDDQIRKASWLEVYEKLVRTALASRASVDVENLKDRVADIIGAEYSSEGVNAEDFARDVAKSTIDHLAAKFPELVGGRE